MNTAKEIAMATTVSAINAQPSGFCVISVSMRFPPFQVLGNTTPLLLNKTLKFLECPTEMLFGKPNKVLLNYTLIVTFGTEVIVKNNLISNKFNLINNTFS